MLGLLLSIPAVQLYLLVIVVLTIAALWTGPSNPPGRDQDARQGPPGPVGDGLSGRLDWRFPGGNVRAASLPLRKLNAACAAEYATRFAKAIEQIRIY
jgi:hypothetical protein